MLAIRLQRKGRKGHAQFRVIVQESRLSPKSGRVVANLGSYDPHTKVATLDTEKAEFYLSNGAQPSERVARLFKSEKVKLPDWVSIVDSQKRTIRNPEKLRKNQPAEEVVEETAVEEPVVEASEEATEPEKAAVEAPVAEASTEEKAE
jgi:small subunit ribosomal protein S16